MNHKQPTQRRGLGRGLGSLIPTATARAGRSACRGDGLRHRFRLVRRRPLRRELGVQSAADAAETGAVTGLNGAGSATATLLEERPAEVAGAYFAELPVSAITPNARQPRQVFEEEAMAELVHSIKEVGPPPADRRTPHR